MIDQGANPQTGCKITCLCAPTTHPGSFRCRLHRASDNHWLIPHGDAPSQQPPPPSSKPAVAKAASEVANMVASSGVEKPCDEAAASSKAGAKTDQRKPSRSFAAPYFSTAGVVFAAGNCQSKLRRMHSESPPPPIFSL